MMLLAPLALACAPAGTLAPLANDPETSLATPSPLAIQEDAQELVALHIAKLSDMVVSPKDAAMLEAFRMLPMRLMELGREIPDFDVPPPVLQMLLQTMTGAKTLQVNMVRSDFPFHAQLNLHMDSKDEANAFHGQVIWMLTESRAPMGDVVDGMTPLHLEQGMPPVLIGPRGSDYVIALGGIDDTPFEAGDTGLPEGVTPSIVARMDYGTMINSFLMLAPSGGGDPDMAIAMEFLDAFGLNELKFHLAAGNDAERSHMSFQMPGYGKHMANNGLIDLDDSITANTLQLVPADAQYATVTLFDIPAFAEYMNEIMGMALEQEGVEDPLGMASQFLPFDLRTGILDHLGSEVGMYLSDSSGGGSLASLVFFLEVENPEGLAPVLQQINGMIQGLGQAEADGYVTTRPWNHDGVSFQSLSFPGLPIPVEPTYAVHGNHMFFGLSPQAAIAAVAQAKGGSGSLMDNPGFRAQFGGDMTGVTGIEFMDTPRLLADGYVWSNMLFTALQNAVRSPSDPDRDPGPVLPSYAELKQGALATVSVTRVVDGDIVIHSRGDRSICVQATGLIGFLSSSGLMQALAFLGMGVAFEEANSASARYIYAEELLVAEPEGPEEHSHSDR